jgi:hypothetical protein
MHKHTVRWAPDSSVPVYQSPPRKMTLRQFHSASSLATYVLKKHFNAILPFLCCFCKWTYCKGFRHQNPLQVRLYRASRFSLGNILCHSVTLLFWDLNFLLSNLWFSNICNVCSSCEINKPKLITISNYRNVLSFWCEHKFVRRTDFQ